MKKYLLSILFILFAATVVNADILTDKAMSKISRDSKTYLYGDYRGATEQEAYDGALSQLSTKIDDYLKSMYGESPTAVYLPELSSLYHRFDNQIAENRYRVMLYVKKSDIKPMKNADGAIVIAKNDQNVYETIPTSKSEPIVVTDTVEIVTVIEKPINPTVSNLMQHRSKDDITSALTEMVKSHKIREAAKFPIASINDYYLAIINSKNEIVMFVHVLNGDWIDLATGDIIDPNNFSDCSSYWFTLPD